MKKPARPQNIDLQSRVFVAANIIFVYYLTVAAVLFAIDKYAPPLFKGEYFSTPTVYMILVWALYYAAPLFWSLVFGLLFRPFWASFRNLMIAILAVHLLVSFVLSMLRWDYVKNYREATRWKKTDQIRLLSLAPKQYDRNQDGLIEEIVIDPVFDFSKLRPGEYLLHAQTEPGGAMSPITIDGGGLFRVVSPSQGARIAHTFVMRPPPLVEDDLASYREKSFKVKFLLFRVTSLDEKGRKLLRFTRWAPFLRETGWEGNDPVLYEDWILLDVMTPHDMFVFLVPPESSAR